MPTQKPNIVQRRVLFTALEHMLDDPVVLLEGPRSVGKSTLLREIASKRGGRILDLDDMATLDAVRADPATLIAGGDLVCIDEYQKAPIVLEAIKSELNKDSRPGRFVLTGSARHESLPAATQALTGRLDRLSVLPLSQGEIAGIHEDWLERFLDNPSDCVTGELSTHNRDDYIDRMLIGGFPMALAASSASARSRWFANYVSLTLERDVRVLSAIRHGALLPEMLGRLAGQSAQVLNIGQVSMDLGLDPTTAANYVSLLEHVFILYRLGAWGKTLNSKSGRLPKIHVTDSAVAAHLMRLTPEKLAKRDASALTQLGHVLETFVVGELRKQASWLDVNIKLGHWRTHRGDEVDLVIERGDGSIVAFEVKAAARVPGEDFRPLQFLRDKLGEAFVGGAVFYLGERSYKYDDRLFVFPVDQLWTPQQARFR